MKLSGFQSNWLISFKSWLEKPCPSDEWLYRGQATKYPTILPSLLRGNAQKFYGNRLYDFDPRIAYTILADSPILKPETLYPEAISTQIDLDREGFTSYITGKRRSDGRIDFSKIIRALAQHYNFPTLFVDLTLDPWVAAAFATHRKTANGYTISDESGTVYRWPARRLSRGLLEIRSECDSEARCIEAIDLSGINKFLRRPRNQRSVLALPVRGPAFTPDSFETPGAAKAFIIPKQELFRNDMMEFSNREPFEIPQGRGEELAHRQAITMLSLFPNKIDLGYSYLTIMALLSLTVHYPESHEKLTNEQAKMRTKGFADGILAGSVILGHECFRLVLGSPLSKVSRQHSLRNAAHTLRVLADRAQEATKLMTTRNIFDKVAAFRKNVAIEMLRELVKDSPNERELLTEAMVNYQDYDIEFRFRDQQIVLVPKRFEPCNSKWVSYEIQRRILKSQDIIKNADNVPAYAFIKPKEYSHFFETFPSYPEYDESILNQIESVRTLMPNEEVFPAFI